MDGSFFFFVGGALVVAALVLAAIGIRGVDSFPSRGAMVGILAAFAALVAVTGAFAWVNASDEQDKRNAELAAQQQEAQAADNGGGQPAAPGQTLDITSPADGSLSFDPSTLQTTATSVTLVYDNPSPVSHNVAVEDSEGKQLGESQLAANTKETLSLTLDPGDYVYYCTVPGHRDGGMEGNLTVK